MRSRNVLQRGLVELPRARHNVHRRRHKAAPGHPSPYTSGLLAAALEAHEKSRKAGDAFGTHVLRSIRGAQARHWQGPHGKIVSMLEGLLDSVGGAVVGLTLAQDNIVRALGAAWEIEQPHAGEADPGTP